MTVGMSRSRVALSLCFIIKARLSLKPLIWKWLYILMQIKAHFHKKCIALSFVILGTRKWPILCLSTMKVFSKGPDKGIEVSYYHVRMNKCLHDGALRRSPSPYLQGNYSPLDRYLNIHLSCHFKEHINWLHFNKLNGNSVYNLSKDYPVNPRC